ncbi:MAG TPA: virulence factor SrfC family protein [Byssovorax sp.]
MSATTTGDLDALAARAADVLRVVTSTREDAAVEATRARELAVRADKLAASAHRPACVGFFGPSQAGKSFLIGALLSHELGSLEVSCRGKSLDFLREINPAKGVESTGVVTRFSTAASGEPSRGDFACRLLSLESVVASLATGFLVECTSPPLDADRVAEALRAARLVTGPAAPPVFAAAWDAVWHDLTKKYQDRHPYLNELRRHAAMQSGAWKADVKTTSGWLHVFSLLWGGPGYAPDLDALLRLLVAGLDACAHAALVEVTLEQVRASSEGASVIDASCLNALGSGKDVVRVFAITGGGAREVAVDPGVLSALIAEIRMPLKPAPGSLLERADILDFPGGRALKGINGFGKAELSSGKLDSAIEVYKRGKLTFLFEQASLDREITALVLCSPGPTKPEAIQLQSQVEAWLKIRHGGPTPATAHEIETPSLFLALTKFDTSLGALRSDNGKDRWDSRVQEACVDFWAKSAASWIGNWGAKGRAFTNLFWIRNPYADQMLTLKPGEPDWDVVRKGYFESRAVARFVKDAEVKWLAVEGDAPNGLPKSGVPLLADALRAKMAEDVKGSELADEAAMVRAELVALLKALTPSRDEAEERERVLATANALLDAVGREMKRRYSGAAFGELVRAIVVPHAELEADVRAAVAFVSPMSVKASDKVKKALAIILKAWAEKAAARVRATSLGVPHALVDQLVRDVLTAKALLPVLGNALLPYFSRTTVDVAVVATILEIKVADALLYLFAKRERAVVASPVRLSFSEAPATSGSSDREGAIEWGSLELDEPSPSKPGADVEIVFAGARFWQAWQRELGPFYLANRGVRAELDANAPGVAELTTMLRQLSEDDAHAR